MRSNAYMSFIAITAVVVLFVQLHQTASEATEADSTGSIHSSVQDALERWDRFLSKNVGRQDSLAKVDKLLSNSFRDRAELFLGGTGRRTVYYLIDDFLQIEAEVRLDDRVENIRVTKKGKWLRQPDGSLYSQPFVDER